MSNYYTMQDSKLALMRGLKSNGWKIYGYKADESDMMTDYYNPASWNGICEKDGFVLVVDQFSAHYSGFEVKKYNYTSTRNNSERIEKLRATMNDSASTENEKSVCERKIEQLKKDSEPTYTVLETYPTFAFGNPKRSNWHIEKDGVIIAKGTGIGSIWCGHSNTAETTEKVEKFVSKFEKAVKSNAEMVAQEVEVVKMVTAFVESDTVEMVEDVTIIEMSTSFTGGFHKGSKAIYKKSYTYNGKTRYEFRRIGKRNQALKHKSENILILEANQFDKWVAEGSIKVGSIQEVKEITTKTVYVKKERTIKPQTVKSDVQSIETISQPVIESTNKVVINEVKENIVNEDVKNESIETGTAYKLNDDKNGIEIYFTDKPSEEIRNEMKMTGFRWSRYNKCWYSKQSPETIALAKKFAGENVQSNTDIEPVQYDEININDVESYTVSESLAKAEHDANWTFRRNEKDHNKHLQDLFIELNNEALKVIATIDNQYYIYKIKSLLQSTKKKYHNAYVSHLSAKASNPSWAVTGRAGRSQRKYEKGIERIEKWEREKWETIDNFNNKLEYYQYKVVKDKENKLQQEVSKAMQSIDVNDIQFTTKRIELRERLYNGNYQCYIADNFFITKTFGTFRIFDLSTKKEVHAMKTKDKLTDAKKYVAYLINQNELQAV